MADDKKPTTVLDAALETSTESTEAKPKARRRKVKRSVPVGRVCIHASENNTIVTFTDLEGGVLCWSSAGSSGFKGTRKSTPYAAKVAAESAAQKVAPFGVQSVAVEIKGLGPGREQAIRGLQSTGLNLDAIIDVTPIPHGGCRPRRRRRV